MDDHCLPSSASASCPCPATWKATWTTFAVAAVSSQSAPLQFVIQMKAVHLGHRQMYTLVIRLYIVNRACYCHTANQRSSPCFGAKFTLTFRILSSALAVNFGAKDSPTSITCSQVPDSGIYSLPTDPTSV